MVEMSKAEPNVYVNNIFDEGETDEDVVYEKCFDPEDLSNYDQLSPVATENPHSTDFNITHNRPSNQFIQEDVCRSQHTQVPWRLLFFLICFLITIVVSNVITFITTKDKFSEKKTQHMICNPSHCLNEGICVNDDKQYYCSCTRGFSGKNCEVTPCTGLDCLNGGSCEVLNATFHCICNLGFSGRLCEDPGPCASNPCFHSGSCIVSGNYYTCSCPNGTEGSRCQDVFYKTIMTPGYPSQYKNKENMTWEVYVGFGNIVRIKFTDFQLESKHDFVKIYGQSAGCLLGSYNGTIVPRDITTMGRYMSVVFTSASSVTKRGFHALIYKTTPACFFECY